jgi:hypothetical protein
MKKVTSIIIGLYLTICLIGISSKYNVQSFATVAAFFLGYCLNQKNKTT